MDNNVNGLKSIFRSLQYRNYRLFFTGQLISLIGTWMQSIALPWLVYRMTGSAFLLGTVSFVSQIPSLFIAPIAGVLTDRYNRYRILIVTQTLAMVQAFALTYFYYTGYINISIIISLGIFLGLVNAFDMPVRQAFVVQMVENKKDLSNAIALNSSMFNGARLLGPTIAGIVIALTNEGVCFLLNGISYIFVIVSILMMNVKDYEEKDNNKKILHELKEGFSFAFGFLPLRAIILLLVLVCLMGMPYTVMMPVFVKEVLQGDSHIFGFLMGATGLGAFTGTMYLASRKSIVGLGRIIAIAASVFGLGLVALSLIHYLPVSMVLMFFIGLGMITQIASTNTIMQTIVEDDMRGRVMSFYTMAIIGVTPFGSLLAGRLASSYGVSFTFLVGGISCLIGAGIYWRYLPRIRTILRPIYVKMGIMQDKSSSANSSSELSVPHVEQ